MLVGKIWLFLFSGISVSIVYLMPKCNYFLRNFILFYLTSVIIREFVFQCNVAVSPVGKRFPHLRLYIKKNL